MMTPGEIARMSELLEEALDLDEPGRRRWLEALGSENRDLEPALREALLPGDRPDPVGPLTLPRIGASPDAAVFRSTLKPGETVGRYRLLRPLGAGGMAEVWLAQRADGAMKREVALKLPIVSRLRKDLEGRFVRERDILAALSHPNIARLYDAGVSDDGVPYIAMEYVAGEPITTWCDSRRLGIRERLELFAQVLDAVEYAHRLQVIHRDIKPSNILVTESGQVRLLDFGVAKLLDSEEDEAELTQLYGRALTPEYASPELLRSEAVGPASDVYSLGVVLYELLSGRRPLHLPTGAPIAMLEMAHSSTRVDPPSKQPGHEAAGQRGTTRRRLVGSLRGDLDAIVLKALARAPADRYESAAAMAEDLKRSQRGEMIRARPRHLHYGLAKLLLRHRVGVGGAVVAAGLVALAVTALRPPAPGPAAPGEAAARAAPGAGDLAPERSIAVLPFVDISEKRDQEYFSDGLSDELITRLAQSTDLKVVARSSSFRFKGRNEDARTIAAQLGVGHLLEGSVRKSGHELRITAQLIRASDGSYLWSQTYDRQLADVFQVQDEIAGTVARSLHAVMEGADRPRGVESEADVEAYDLVLEGNYFKARRTPGDLDRAIELYRKAIGIRPGYAIAWARLGSAFMDQARRAGGASAGDRAKILDALNRAIRLDPKLLWAYYSRAGFRLYYDLDWAAAEADHERMRAADPRDAYLVPVTQADMTFLQGRFDEALPLYQKVLERNPLDPNLLDDLAYAQCAAARLEECLKSRQEMSRLHSDRGRVHANLGEAYLLSGRVPEALEEWKKEPESDARLAGLAMAFWSAGRRAESDAALQALADSRASSQAFTIAEVHAWRGEPDAALEWLDRAFGQHDAQLMLARADPLLSGLRGDPRFRALVLRLKIPS